MWQRTWNTKHLPRHSKLPSVLWQKVVKLQPGYNSFGSSGRGGGNQRDRWSSHSSKSSVEKQQMREISLDFCTANDICVQCKQKHCRSWYQAVAERGKHNLNTETHLLALSHLFIQIAQGCKRKQLRAKMRCKKVVQTIECMVYGCTLKYSLWL